MIHDPKDPNCKGCHARVDTADPYLQSWFWAAKKKDNTLHCSWGWRGEDDQNALVASGASRTPFPTSKHNYTIGELPHSLALDVFQLLFGKAVFSPNFCSNLFTWSLTQGYQLAWGGTFHTIHDLDHFQIEKPSVA